MSLRNNWPIFILVFFSALTPAVVLVGQYTNQTDERIGSAIDLIPDATFWSDENIFEGFKNIGHGNKMAKSKTNWNDTSYKSINTELNNLIHTPLVAEVASSHEMTDDKLESLTANSNSVTHIEQRHRNMNGLDRIIAAHASRHSSFYYPHLFDHQVPFLKKPGFNPNLKPDDMGLANDLESNNILLPDNLEDYAHFEDSAILNGVENFEWTDDGVDLTDVHVTASEPQSLFLFLVSLLFLFWRFNLLPNFFRNLSK